MQPNFANLKPVGQSQESQPNFSALKTGSVTPTPVQPNQSLAQSVWNGLSTVGKALTSSEQAFGQDIAGGASAILPKGVTGQDKLDQASQTKQNTVNTIISQIHQTQQKGGDPSKYLKLLSDTTGQPVTGMSDLYPALKKSNLQVTGDAAGTLLDILSAGSYGNAAKGAKTGELLSATEKIAQPAVEQTLGQTLKTIGKETAVHSAVGAGTGYAYDVAGNLQQGKTGTGALKPGLGTLAGGAVPAVIGGLRAGVAITKDTAPRFINSLIKPKQADFSYGKDPGRTVSEMGITGNSLSDFGKNVNEAKQDIGSQIGAIYSSPENSTKVINAEDDINKIDDAIKEAAKGGKGNQTVVTNLQNIKDAILYEHGVDAEGSIVKQTNVPRDLSALSPKEAFDLKEVVAEQTKFTGNPSDDKTVNSVLKDIYGGLKTKLNDTVGENNPEITDLNQKYADLTSASLAIKNRDAIIKRSAMVSLPVKIGTATALITGLTGGVGAIPALLAGVTTGMLDKALESTAVKTRVASWLGSESTGTIAKVLEQNPGISTSLYRLVPKLASPNKAQVSPIDMAKQLQDAANGVTGDFSKSKFFSGKPLSESEQQQVRTNGANLAMSMGTVGGAEDKILQSLQPRDLDIMERGISYLRAPHAAEFDIPDNVYNGVERIARKIGVSLDQPFAKIANQFENILAKAKK